MPAHLRTRGGRVHAMHGFELDKDVSIIGQGLLDTQDDELRIRTPMVRQSWLANGRGSNTSARGNDTFVSVSWKEAEKLVADELDHVRKSRGNNAIFAILQKYNRVNLVVPVDAPHMWDAAVESKTCTLTALGEHYRRLVAGDMI